MEWIALVTPFIGVVIGGVITYLGQREAHVQAQDAQVSGEQRAAAAARVDRQRTATRELHAAASADLAEFRKRHNLAGESGHVERAELLDALKHDVSERADLRGAQIAIVSSSEVRSAADKMYTSWVEWLAFEVDSLVNELRNPIQVTEVIEADHAFSEAVRAYLRELDEREDDIYVTQTSSGLVRKVSDKLREIGPRRKASRTSVTLESTQLKSVPAKSEPDTPVTGETPGPP